MFFIDLDHYQNADLELEQQLSGRTKLGQGTSQFICQPSEGFDSCEENDSPLINEACDLDFDDPESFDLTDIIRSHRKSRG